MIKKILSLLARWRNTEQSPSIKFPYESKIIDFGKIPNPLVALQLKTNENFYLRVKFLVDSGADTTTLPLNPYGKLVGFNPRKETKTIIGGVEGKGVTAYPGQIEIKIGQRKIKLSCYFVQSQIMPLLGRCDFWKHFSIIFDNRLQETVLEPIQKSLDKYKATIYP